MKPTLDKLTDRQKEALVAQKVMGWKRIGRDEPFRLHVANGGCICQDDSVGVFRRGVIPESWHPITDLNHAFEVWNKLKHRKPVLVASGLLTACSMLASDDEEDNEYTFEEDGTTIITRRHVKAIRGTPAQAIIDAALLAVGAVAAKGDSDE